MRKPFSNKVADPRYGNNHIDAHFLDTVEGEQTEAVERILGLHQDGKFTLLIPYSVKVEIEHKNTPSHVKERARQFVYTESVGLTQDEQELHEQTRTLMRGNAKPGKHDADAIHIVEAAKHGGRYFITNDGRILSKKEDLSMLVGISVVMPTEFLEAYEECSRTDEEGG